MKNIMNSFKSNTRFILASSALALTLIVAGSPVPALAQALTRQLQLGMSGTDVSTLQTFLATDSTVYPQGLVTGYFGPMTRTAVSNFQAKNGIATVGRVGPQTLAVINAQMGSGSTVGADRTAPTIYGVATTSVTNTSAMMNWNTNENASSLLYYSTAPLTWIESSANTGVTVSGTSMLVHADLRSAHTATLTSLLPNTTYNYVIYVRDASGNETVSWPSTFRTNQ